MNSVDQVANGILENINKAVVVNPIALISLILLNAEHHILNEQDLITQLSEYRLLLSQTNYDDRMILTELSGAQIIQYALKLKQVEYFNQNNEKSIRVAESQKILLSYFNNNILHCFILPALIALVIHTYQKISRDALINTIRRIYPYLKEEFFLKWQSAELEHQIDLTLSSLAQLGWIVQHDSSIATVPDQAMQHKLKTLAQLCSASLNNMLIMSALLNQFAATGSLSIKELEKMSKAVLQKLAQTGKIPSAYYFDSATLKSFSSSLQQHDLLSITDGVLQVSDDFEAKILSIFHWYGADIAKAILTASQFNEKELKTFKQLDKK